MNSLTYLLLCGIKNRIKEIFKKPGKLIAYILGILFFGAILLPSLFMEIPEIVYNGYEAAEPNYALLMGIFFGFFVLTFLTTVLPALKGTSQYGMEDVNNLFVAPLRPRTILLYGIIQSFKTILIGSWFVLFQASWLQSGYYIGIGGVFLLWVGYVIFALVCQIIAIFLYAMTNGSRSKIFRAKIIIAMAFAPFVIGFIVNLLGGGTDLLATLGATVDSAFTDFTPVVGWAARGVFGLVTGDALTAVIFLGLVVVLAAVLLVIIYVKEPDYYEHVSAATQTAFEAQRAAAEGNVTVMMGADSKKTKLKGTGINSGEGASVFLRKHLRESFRQRRFGLWGIPTLLYVAAAGVFAFFNRSGHYCDYGIYHPAEHIWVVITILAIMVLISFFGSGTSRGSLEIYTHYIYMVPASPFKKWLWANSELVFKNIVEGVLIFGVAAVVFGGGYLNFAIAAVVYITFTFYTLGMSLAFMRISGIASRSLLLSVLVLFLYFVPTLPGLAAAIIVAVIVGGSAALPVGMLIFAAWNLAVGLGCFALSRGMLHDCDMLTMDGVMKDLQ